MPLIQEQCLTKGMMCIMGSMLALVYYGPGDVRLEHRPLPVPGKGEVLIKMRAASICGSDLGAYKLKEVSDRWNPPIVLGHEFSGEIAALGPDAKKYTIGQRVTANPILYCGDCYYCKKGMINLCSHRSSFGTSIGGKTTDGALQEYFTIRESAVIPLDDRLSLSQGALLEPLAVCYCAAKKASFGRGERVAVIGAGPIGLMIVKFLKAFGAQAVLVTDILDTRLEFAKKYGADETINVKNESGLNKVMESTAGVGVDRVIITAGNPTAIPDALGMVRNGGNIVLVAMTHYKLEIEPLQLVARGVSLIGTYMFTTEQKDVMRIAEQKLHADDIVTSVYPLSQSADVFRSLVRPDCKDVKVLITS